MAGGRATRLRHMAVSRPKALQLVNGVPLLDRLVDVASAWGLDQFHFCLGFQHETVLTHLRQRRLDFTYSLDDQPGGSGTAGALRTAAPYLADVFVLWLADTLPVTAGGEPRPPEPHIATMTLCHEVPGVTPNVAATEGRVTAYRKDGAGTAEFVDAGLYSVTREILRYVPAGRADLESVWPRLIDDGQLGAVVVDGVFLDIGTPARLARARALLATRHGRAPTT